MVASAGLGLGCSGADGGAGARVEVAESTSPPAALTTAALTTAPRCELPNGGYAGECNVCLAARCCEPIEACKGDAECALQLSCEVQCQYDAEPGACTARCFAEGPHRLYTPYDDCSFADCRASCWS